MYLADPRAKVFTGLQAIFRTDGFRFNGRIPDPMSLDIGERCAATVVQNHILCKRRQFDKLLQ